MKLPLNRGNGKNSGRFLKHSPKLVIDYPTKKKDGGYVIAQYEGFSQTLGYRFWHRP